MKKQTTNKNPALLVLCGFLVAGLVAVIVLIACLAIQKYSSPTITKIYTEPKQIAPYLYEMTFSDYVIDKDEVTHNSMEAFGCSSVRNGDYYGRNYDYIFNDSPEFVVHMEAAEGRHASVGVAAHYGLREANLLRGEYDKQLEIIPNFTLDGINDAGVIASINVVPGKEDIGELTGTNPDGEPLNAAYAVRYILDNAKSADDAVALLKTRNLYGTAVSGLYLHIMIADPAKTYVVEFIDNKMVAQVKTGDEQIMTNFYVNIPELTDHASGVERYQILKENYNEGNSMVGMRNLMARVKYSNAYNYSTYPAWYSESIPQSLIKNQDSPEFAKFLEIFDNVRKDYWNYVTNDIRNPANTTFWHTTHNSIYDIKNRTLRLTVQENYSDYFDFSLE